jgi:hypothetical protein
MTSLVGTLPVMTQKLRNMSLVHRHFAAAIVVQIRLAPPRAAKRPQWPTHRALDHFQL